MDKKDLITFFQEMRIFFMTHLSTNHSKMGSGSIKTIEKEKTEWLESNMEELFEQYEVSKLDIRRMYRYLDKNVKKDIPILSLDNDDTEDE
jgi:hypothetical protein